MVSVLVDWKKLESFICEYPKLKNVTGLILNVKADEKVVVFD